MRIGLLALSWAVLLGLSGCGRVEPGKKAPEFALKDPSGQDLKLSDLRGRVVLLFFWATWAPPCRLMIPDLVRMQWKHDRGIFNVVAVAVDDGEPEISSYLKQVKVNFPVVICDGAAKAAYFGDGDVQVPLTLLLDGRGIILERFVGYHAGDDIGPAVEEALKNNSKD